MTSPQGNASIVAGLFRDLARGVSYVARWAWRRSWWIKAPTAALLAGTIITFAIVALNRSGSSSGSEALPIFYAQPTTEQYGNLQIALGRSELQGDSFTMPLTIKNEDGTQRYDYDVKRSFTLSYVAGGEVPAAVADGQYTGTLAPKESRHVTLRFEIQSGQCPASLHFRSSSGKSGDVPVKGLKCITTSVLPPTATPVPQTATTATPVPQEATKQEITQQYDLAVTYFNVFWKDWRGKVIPSLLTSKPNFDNAEIYAGAYKKYAASGAAAADKLVATETTAAAISGLRAALHALADGSVAAEAAATARDPKALDTAATTIGDGARRLQDVKALVDALK